mgnify:CR=1 FL=1
MHQVICPKIYLQVRKCWLFYFAIMCSPRWIISKNIFYLLLTYWLGRITLIYCSSALNWPAPHQTPRILQPKFHAALPSLESDFLQWYNFWSLHFLRCNHREIIIMNVRVELYVESLSNCLAWSWSVCFQQPIWRRQQAGHDRSAGNPVKF